MAEWLKAHAWKACIPQGIQGSNPCLSAINLANPSQIQIDSYWEKEMAHLFFSVFASASGWLPNKEIYLAKPSCQKYSL